MRNFKRKEFACKCGCGFATIDVELLEALELLRLTFSAPVVLTSACRCERHNRSVGGADGSKHKLGIAADVVVSGVNPHDVYEFLNGEYGDKYGLGNYDTFTHVDVRNEKARW